MARACAARGARVAGTTRGDGRQVAHARARRSLFSRVRAQPVGAHAAELPRYLCEMLRFIVFTLLKDLSAHGPHRGPRTSPRAALGSAPLRRLAHAVCSRDARRTARQRLQDSAARGARRRDGACTSNKPERNRSAFSTKGRQRARKSRGCNQHAKVRLSRLEQIHMVQICLRHKPHGVADLEAQHHSFRPQSPP